MKVAVRFYALLCSIFISAGILFSAQLAAQDRRFHNAPPSSHQKKNPYAGQSGAVAAGARLYALNCRSCHGINGRGTGNVPPLSHGPTQSASDGEIFWFITTGSVDNGMPSWASLSEQKRWQIVAYLKSLKNSRAAKAAPPSPKASSVTTTNAPPPAPAFTDFLTGVVADDGDVWGRPVGIAVAQDGSLLVSDDGSNSIWRVSYTGAASQKNTQERKPGSDPAKRASR